ncbi:hypothetical protein M514_07249 [Trichuris suis]|uniref:Uncharacterized protein n=1 Tax=Trichuris suis TaxID=68888 RepID=A0A085N1H6_9BILA|nr:hypothetical protein M513_07249 [Trichuris suis]KFD63322.1 hypothetical protein M514_07249 [Trichuris suis]
MTYPEVKLFTYAVDVWDKDNGNTTWRAGNESRSAKTASYRILDQRSRLEDRKNANRNDFCVEKVSVTSQPGNLKKQLQTNVDSFSCIFHNGTQKCDVSPSVNY